MPSLFHESVVDLLEDAISTGIARARDRMRTRAGRRLAAELGRMYKGRSAAVHLSCDNRSLRRSKTKEPDASWYHPAQPRTPTCVLEVAYSQHLRALQRTARQYMESSHQGIRTVLGIKLPYPQRTMSSRASLLLYRPTGIQKQPYNFRKRAPTRDTIKFYPDDFVPQEVLPRAASLSTLFEITLESIAGVIAVAESRTIVAETTLPPVPALATFRKQDELPKSQPRPTSAKGPVGGTPCTPVKPQKHQRLQNEAVMTKAGLWTPPNSQEKSSSGLLHESYCGDFPSTPTRRSSGGYISMEGSL